MSRVQRRNRLSRSRDFDAVYRHGRSVSTRFLTLYWFEREEAVGDPRLGFAVPKAVGNAVVRNRIKRQLREIVRGRLERRAGDERLRARRAPGACPRRPRRTGTTGSRSASTRCSGRPRREHAPSPIARPIRLYQLLVSPLPAGEHLQVPPELLRVRGARDPQARRAAGRRRWPAGGCSAATRGRTAESTTRDRRSSILHAARERDEVDPRLLPHGRRPAVGVVDRRADDPRAHRARAADGAADPLDAVAPGARAGDEGDPEEVQGRPRRSSTKS